MTIGYGVNLHSKEDNCWFRLANFEDEERARNFAVFFVSYSNSMEAIEPYDGIEIEKIMEKENGDFEYITIASFNK